MTPHRVTGNKRQLLKFYDVPDDFLGFQASQQWEALRVAGDKQQDFPAMAEFSVSALWLHRQRQH